MGRLISTVFTIVLLVMFGRIPVVSAQQLSCSPAKFCRAMDNCAEAVFYLYNCNSLARDRDDDGIPCEVEVCGDTPVSFCRRLKAQTTPTDAWLKKVKPKLFSCKGLITQ